MDFLTDAHGIFDKRATRVNRGPQETKMSHCFTTISLTALLCPFASNRSKMNDTVIAAELGAIGGIRKVLKQTRTEFEALDALKSVVRSDKLFTVDDVRAFQFEFNLRVVRLEFTLLKLSDEKSSPHPIIGATLIRPQASFKHFLLSVFECIDCPPLHQIEKISVCNLFPVAKETISALHGITELSFDMTKHPSEQTCLNRTIMDKYAGNQCTEEERKTLRAFISKLTKRRRKAFYSAV